MLKAIVRTGAAVGTFYLIGYVARKYFGANTNALLEQGKEKAKDFTKNLSTNELKAPLKDVAERHAV